MTFAERVTDRNKAFLQQCIINGAELHPGALDVIRNETVYVGNAHKLAAPTKGTTQQTAATDKNKTGPTKQQKLKENKLASNTRFPLSIMPRHIRVKRAQGLMVGDIVNRHMMQGDIVLFNRQPSLHRMSIMAHKVRVQDGRTFRFNECVCSPYNADFDGDEMNIHLPQTYEARAEAYHLMGVKNNIITPKNGEPIIACTQDFLTASFLLTQKDNFFPRAQVCQMVAHATKAKERLDLLPPAVLKPLELWTGKQVFSMILRPSALDRNMLVNATVEERSYSKKEHRKGFDAKDGFVEFRNSELVSGCLGKKTLGDGAKTGLFSRLCRDVTVGVSARMMGRVARFSAR